MRLRAGKYYGTNDPREYMPLAISGENIKHPEYNDDNTFALFRIAHEARKNTRLICFSKDDTGADNDIMWAFYGDAFKGICLEIDENLFKLENDNVFKSDKSYFCDVSYDKEDSIDNQPSFHNAENNWDEANERFIKANKEYLFFQKSKYWSNENEKRLVFVDSKFDGFLNISKSLKNIHVGLNANRNYLAAVERFFEKKQINIQISLKIFDINTRKFISESHHTGDYRNDIIEKYKNLLNE